MNPPSIPPSDTDDPDVAHGDDSDTTTASAAVDAGGSNHAVIDSLKASHLKQVLHEYSDALKQRRKGIDKLNVYPVPDGDTGTNMSLTVQSVVAELKNAASDDMHSISSAISKGAIMGARGNSGAILAQVLRGIAESAKEKTVLHPSDVADAFERAKTGAYESVLKPVEGTILTVVSAAATAARQQADNGAALKEQISHVREAASEALARTPELLPMLKQAGVVDAGGKGFLLFIDALRYVATGEPISCAVDTGNEGDVDSSNIEHNELSELRYEVMFLLEGDDTAIPGLREAWGHVGDSIVVVGGDGLWNCHIHSDDIGRAIEVALDYGRPSQIRVTDLLEQAADHAEGWRDDGPGEHGACATAVVAVANGPGITRIFRSLGVQELVKGGQSSNPSVAELLHAVEMAPAECVVILPNNKNVIAAAQQVDALTEKSVVVVPTRSIVEGMVALVGYNPSASAEENASAMVASSENVKTGEITQAVRSTVDDGREIASGNWIGLSGGKITVIEDDVTTALLSLAESMLDDTHELMTLVGGEGADSSSIEALRHWLSENAPEVELEVHEGGQPLYPYLLGVE